MSRLASVAFVVLVALGTSACGDSSGADTPPMITQLEAVDDAVVAEDAGQLESAIGNLLRTVDDAEAVGDVDPARADRIRRAAEALLEAAAPTSRPPTEPTEPTEPSTATTPPPAEDDEEEVDDPSRPAPAEPPGKDKDKDKSEGKAKGHHRDD